MVILIMQRENILTATTHYSCIKSRQSYAKIKFNLGFFHGYSKISMEL